MDNYSEKANEYTSLQHQKEDTPSEKRDGILSDEKPVSEPLKL